MGNMINVYKIFVGEAEGMTPFLRPGRRQEEPG
jgi:hypothetical protein